MRLLAIVVCMGAVVDGCYAQRPTDGSGVPSEPTTTTNEPVSPAEPAASDSVPKGSTSAGPESGAADMDAKFASETRDSAWATDTEQLVDGLMTSGGGKAIEPLVCKTTVCRGTYQFPSRDARREAWTWGVHGSLTFPNHTLRVARPATAPAAEDTYYIVKDPNLARPYQP